VTPENTLTGSDYEQWYSTSKTWSGTAPGSGGSGSLTWTYTHQLKVTFDATSQLKADTSATIVTVSGAAKTGAQLPYTTGWLNSGTSLTYSFSSSVASASNPTTARYNWTSTSGLQTSRSKTFSVTAGGTITGNYNGDFYLTVNSPYASTKGKGWYTSPNSAYASRDLDIVDHGNDTRHVFVQWTGDASGTGLTSNAIEMTAPKTATANWKTQHQVAFTVNPSGQGTMSPSGKVWCDAEADSVAIAAVAEAGYVFTSWTTTPTITAADPKSSSTTLTVNGPGTVTANFEAATDLPTALTIQCTPETVDKEGTQTTTITGTLTHAETPLPKRQVSLSYFDGVNWVPIETVTTAADGTYTASWDAPAALPNGLYPIKAEFAGDATYAGSEAVTGTTGNGASVFVAPEYAFGALIALAACFTALVLFKRSKRQKP
jgi:hypothetical protein